MSTDVWLGIDDTDMLDTPGTNQLARHLVRLFGHAARPSMITRHQLLQDPRVPCTRQNGCACIRFATSLDSPQALVECVREVMQSWCPRGSDPGLCMTTDVPTEVVAFGRRCQRELVRQQEARDLAARFGIHLEGLAGTQDGVIGALAAVGLQNSGNDGRVVHCGTSQSEPFDIVGVHSLETILACGVVDVLRHDDDTPVTAGTVALQKKLRPNLRGGRIVLYVEPNQSTEFEADWHSVKVV